MTLCIRDKGAAMEVDMVLTTCLILTSPGLDLEDTTIQVQRGGHGKGYGSGYLPHPNLKRIIGDNTIQVQRGCHGKGYGSGYLPHPNPRRTIEEQREDSQKTSFNTNLGDQEQQVLKKMLETFPPNIKNIYCSLPCISGKIGFKIFLLIFFKYTLQYTNRQNVNGILLRFRIKNK